MIAADEGVPGEDQLIVLVEELDVGGVCHLDVDEDEAEGAGCGPYVRSRQEEGHIGDVAVDGREQLLRAESLKVARKAEQRGNGPAGVGADEEARARRGVHDAAGRVGIEEVGG